MSATSNVKGASQKTATGKIKGTHHYQKKIIFQQPCSQKYGILRPPDNSK